MVALSPQKADALETLRGQRKLTFPILVDHNNAVGEQFGLRFEFEPELRDVYRSFGIDLAEANGEDSWSLAMPARYLVDTSGVVRWMSADPDYTRRPEPEETIEALRAL